MKKNFFCIVLISASFNLVSFQENNPKVNVEGLDSKVVKAVELITPDLLKMHLEYIASDEMEGRKIGSEGSKKATEYIALQFKEAGLKPIGDKDENGKPTYFQKFGKGRNCAGLLEGSDEKLKDEIVLIGAHHDHLGAKKVEGKDGINNGADDDGSGTTAVITIALAFKESGLRPKRSIIFMTFDGEESGLLGSKHYVSNPLMPWEKHAAEIQMDMLGRLCTSKKGPWETPFEVVGLYYWEQKEKIMELIKSNGERNGLKPHFELKKGARMRSDHKSFLDKKLPAIYVHEDPGDSHHVDYHKPSDESQKILYDRMTAIVRIVLLTLNDFANLEERPKYSSK